jgi:hypothetical protein
VTVRDNVRCSCREHARHLFIPGAFFGLVTIAIALWRSRAVPRGAVLLIPLFIITDFFLQQGLIGHAIALIGAVWIASAVLRAPVQAKRL